MTPLPFFPAVLTILLLPFGPSAGPSSREGAKVTDESRNGRIIRVLPAPRGPVRIEHIEGTNLLIIIGRGERPGGHESGLELPRGPVQVESIPGTDLLWIRASGGSRR
jgi:hypothetical protein